MYNSAGNGPRGACELDGTACPCFVTILCTIRIFTPFLALCDISYTIFPFGGCTNPVFTARIDIGTGNCPNTNYVTKGLQLAWQTDAELFFIW
jgi:hypothetical protein